MSAGEKPGENPGPQETSISFITRKVLHQEMKNVIIKAEAGFMNIEQILYLSKQSIEEALVDPARLILGQGRMGVASEGQVVVVVEAK